MWPNLMRLASDPLICIGFHTSQSFHKRYNNMDSNRCTAVHCLVHTLLWCFHPYIMQYIIDDINGLDPSILILFIHHWNKSLNQHVWFESWWQTFRCFPYIELEDRPILSWNLEFRICMISVYKPPDKLTSFASPLIYLPRVLTLLYIEGPSAHRHAGPVSSAVGCCTEKISCLAAISKYCRYIRQKSNL